MSEESAAADNEVLAWSPADLDRRDRTISSALWAAWADALGFISELTDETGLRRRLGGRDLVAPVAWKRRVGGKFGVQADLPEGCYSDDTQLRLASARAISADGFDVEAFARIELTIWPCYALGGGRSTRAAAAGMGRANASWFANFYEGFENAGGNGVAMRIQPHVWSERNLAGDSYFAAILSNGVVSHGHPRALVGAVLHAASLAMALREAKSPTWDNWDDLLLLTRNAVDLFDRVPELSNYWRPQWERQSNRRLKEVWHATVDECSDALKSIRDLSQELASAAAVAGPRSMELYAAIVQTLELDDPSTRGSGTLTVVASLALAAAFEARPGRAAVIAANAVGTDTDTIATMAGAVLGAAGGCPEPANLLDLPFLKAEAERLAAIGLGRPAQRFFYPDLLSWSPPTSQLDCVGLANGEVALAGLGWLTPIDEPIHGKDAQWQWTRSAFGASFLVKKRPVLRDLATGNVPVRRSVRGSRQSDVSVLQRQDRERQSRMGLPMPVDRFAERRSPVDRDGDFARETKRKEDSRPPDGSELHVAARRALPRPSAQDSVMFGNVEQILAWLEEQNFDDESVGYAFNRIMPAWTLEQVLVFAGVLRERMRHRTRRP